MGCDICCFAEVKREGKWVTVPNDSTFNYRHYSVFAFLAGVRNNFGVTPIIEPRGLPMDSEHLNAVCKFQYNRHPYLGDKLPEEKIPITVGYDIELDINNHSHGWLLLKELIDFDYNQTFEDRAKMEVVKGKNTIMFGSSMVKQCPEGEGKITTYREFLPNRFFEDLIRLQKIGDLENVRIIFWFD